jgi:hypothetical protein
MLYLIVFALINLAVDIVSLRTLLLISVTSVDIAVDVVSLYTAPFAFPCF